MLQRGVWARRWIRWFIVVIAVVTVVIWWLGSSVTLPHESSFWLAEPGSLRELRAAAGEDGPQDVHVGIIGRTELPRWFNTAWGGLGPERRVFITLQLVYPNGHVMIDTPFGPDTHREIVGDDAPFDAQEWSRMQRALSNADSIFITHVHRDHLGGIVDSGHPRELLSRTAVTPEQKAGFRRVSEVEPGDPSTLGFDVEDFDDLDRILEFSRLSQVAPGLVALKTPGHTPGHLMYFIRTADGRDLLYVGDLVWSYRNVVVGRSRPRVVAQYFLGEDTSAVANQLRALMIFSQTNPDVEILVSHDADRLERQIDDGVVRLGLR